MSICNAPKQDLILLSFICISHSMSSILFSAIPFLFMHPKLICKNKNFQFDCSENLACSTYKNNFFIDYNRSEKSIVTDFGLICEKRFQKAYLESAPFFGTTISGLFCILNLVKPEHLYLLIGFCQVLSAVSALFFIFIENIYLLFFFYVLLNLFLNVNFIIHYVFAQKQFSSNLNKFTPTILNTAWGTSSIIFPIVFYIFYDWRKSLIVYLIIPSSVMGIFFMIYYRYNDFSKAITIKNEENDLNLLKLPKKLICKKCSIFKNFVIFSFFWAITNLTLAGLFVGTDTLIGGVYLNTILFGVIEMFCGFISGKLLKHYNEGTLLRICLYINSFLLFGFYFQPKKNEKISYFVAIFYLSATVISKVGIEFNWNFGLTYLPKITLPDFYHFFLSSAVIFGSFLTLFCPYYTELMRIFEISPFFGYGILMLALSISTHFLTENISISNEELNALNKENKDYGKFIELADENSFEDKKIELNKGNLII